MTNTSKTETKEEILERQIVSCKALSIDPFEVFERMKQAGLNAMNEYALKSNKDLLESLKKYLELRSDVSNDVLNIISLWLQSLSNEINQKNDQHKQN